MGGCGVPVSYTHLDVYKRQVLDHIHYFFEFTGCIPTVFSMLGRLSAPLFLFCTVEGLSLIHI